MPLRSKVITTLPPNIREEVERRMMAKRFSDYEGLAEWVREQGYDISGDSLWRYGKLFREEIAVTQLALHQARALADETPDRKGRMTQALIQVVQQKLLSALAEADELDPAGLSRLVHTIAELNRVALLQQQLTTDTRREKRERRQKEQEAHDSSLFQSVFWNTLYDLRAAKGGKATTLSPTAKPDDPQRQTDAPNGLSELFGEPQPE
jgi:hypothetical protein